MYVTCCKHLFERAEDRCRTCGNPFCADCLVYAFGARRPPFCLGCAIAAAGIRSTARVGKASRRELRAAAKERRAKRKSEAQPVPEVAEALATALAEQPVPPTIEETAVDPAADLDWVPTPIAS